ncbi:MAG: efflux RND transporter periplasmic adaptor subunit [Fuerstia sp.]|nr:efflux RND transporter periplasmic adaptor subunit [Fuerstiella sp.]
MNDSEVPQHGRIERHQSSIPHAVFGFIVLTLTAISLPSAFAHEGHKPLPTRGMEVNAETGKMVLTKSARSTLDVQTAEVRPQKVTQSILAYGTLISPWNRHAMVSSPLSGRIVELLVSPGESVKAGQLLAELDSPELESLQLEIRNAQTALNLSLKLQASAEAAGKTGAIPGIRFIEAKNQVQQDRAAVEIARAKWLSLQLPLEALETMLQTPNEPHQQRLALKSPIDGTVTHTDLSVGKVVNSKEHLFEVLDLSSVWLKIGVLEKDLALVTIGQSLELTLTAYPNQKIPAQVDVFGQFLDPQTHLGTVWASLPNSASGDLLLLPGMSGQVQLKVGDTSEKIVVPMSAVIRDGAERFVLVEEEQTQVASAYQKQTIVFGQRMGDVIEVHGGNLFPGDRVVTRGSHELGSFFTKGVLKVSGETARDIGLALQPASQLALAETITVDGLVDVPPTRRTVASAQLSGSIARILVDRGQKVRAGEVLAEIVSQDFQNLQLDLLRAHLDAELQQEIMSNLGDAGDAVSQRRLWEAESRLNLANGLRENVRQRLTTAGIPEEQLTQLVTTRTLLPTLPVRSPIDGVVMDFDKVLGHVVQPDESVFEIHDLSQAWVQGFVSERDLARVKVGQTVRVRFVADAAEVVTGTLVRSGRSVGQDDRTLSVWIELKQMPRVPIQHNMLARVTIETGTLPPQLAVPREAIVREGTRSYVFVHNADDIFERRFVVLGRSDDVAVQILEGLVPNDSVAVGGAMALQSGYAALR